MASPVHLAPSQVDLLNLARAAAAQLVLIGHAAYYYYGGGTLSSGYLGTIGVLVFFLLSGFLICSSVVQKWDRPDYRLQDYLVDRFCRIFVAYGPALLFLAAVDTALRTHPAYPWGADATLGSWFGNLVMLQDYPVFPVLRRLGVPEQAWFIRPFGSGRPFWTIAIEWWIYLFFGYFVYVVLRKKRLTLKSLLVLIALGVVPAYNTIGGFGRCLSFVWLAGALLALLQNWRARRAAERNQPLETRRLVTVCLLWTVACAAMMAGRAAFVDVRVYDLQFALFLAGALSGIFLLVGAVNVVLPRWLSRDIGFLADYSYSLYLIHYTLLTGFALYYPSATENDPLMFLAVIAVANLCSIGFWFAFERHYRAVARAVRSALDRQRDLRPAAP